MISIYDSLITQMKLGSNIFNNIQSFTTSLQRLISGAKITSPKDSPSGFYIASNFSTQIRGLETANKNIQTAANMLNMADGSIKEINDIMGQIRELTEKSTNEYMTPGERESNQKKINELFAQAQKIKNDTEFNGNKLFSNSTKLDKNQTYTDSNTPKPVTTASNQTLNRIGDNPTSYTTDTAVATASTVPLEGAAPISDDAEETSAPAPMRMNRMAAYSSTPTAEDWGTSGMNYLGANQTKLVQINGKTYTLQKNGSSAAQVSFETNSDGTIYFSGSNYTITAADGQNDRVSLGGGSNGISNVTFNAGDGDDVIYTYSEGITVNAGSGKNTLIIGSQNSTINGGSGDDVIITDYELSNVTINGGGGNNVLFDKSGKNSAVNVTKGEDWGTTGTKTLAANSSVLAKIGDKIYTIKNDDNKTYEISYSNDNDRITFNGGWNNKLTITAAEGQEDDIILGIHSATLNTGDMNDRVVIAGEDPVNNIYGGNATVNTGDGDDIVIVKGTGNTINTGTGNNSVIESTSNGVVTIAKNESKILNIKGNLYTVTNINGTGNLSYEIVGGYHSHDIGFTGNGWKIEAFDGQEDNLNINGHDNEIFTGDMDDIVVVGSIGAYSSRNNTVHGGDGNDNITIIGTSGIAYGDAGNDTITLHNYGGSELKGYGGDGDDKFIVTSYDGKVIVDGGAGSNNVTNTGAYTFTQNIQSSSGDPLNGMGPREINVDLSSMYSTVGFLAGETVILNINGKKYTVTNDTEYTSSIGLYGNTLSQDSNALGFEGNFFTIKAAEGQNDDILIMGYHNVLDTGDGDDIIWSSAGAFNIIDAGAGNDTIHVGSGTENSWISGGEGTNNIIIEDEGSAYSPYANFIAKGSSTSTVTDNTGNKYGENRVFDKMVSLEGNSGEKTVTMNGKTYTISANNPSVNNAVMYNEGDSLTLGGRDYTVTAANGQNDNIILATSTSGTINLNTGDGNDRVTILSGPNKVNTGSGNNFVDIAYDANNNTIDGAGGNTIVSNNGHSNTIQNASTIETSTAGTISISKGSEKIINVDGKLYTIVNTNSTGDLSYALNTKSGEITFTGDGWRVEAFEGQEDNLKILGKNNEIFAGDMDDTISVGEVGAWDTNNNVIHGGAGNDTISMTATTGIIYGDDGDDTITLHNYGDSSHLQGFGGDGNDSFIITGTQHTDGDDYRDHKATIDGGGGTNSVQNTGNFTYGSNIQNAVGDALTNSSGSGATDNNVDWTNTQVGTVGANSSVTAKIGDKVYTFTNNTSSDINVSIGISGNDIVLDTSNLIITAADGQEDHLRIHGQGNEIFAGDMDDTIYVTDTYDSTAPNIVHGGDGNDNITIFGTIGIAYGDAGNDTINLQTSGMGADMHGYGGDGDDTFITDSNYSPSSPEYNEKVTIDGGSGTNSVQNTGGYTFGTDIQNVTGDALYNPNNWGGIGSSGSKTFAGNETRTVIMDGKTYTIQNNSSSEATIEYTVTSGLIILGGGDYSKGFTITAADGQNDRLDIGATKDANNWTINTGDGDDYVIVSSSGHTVNLGDGNDSAIIDGANNTVSSGTGNDNIVVKGFNTEVNLDDGDQTVTVNSGSENTSINNASKTDTITDNGIGTAISTAGETSGEGGITDWGESGNITLNAGESKTIKINGKTYTLENISGNSEYVEGSMSGDTVYFAMSGVKVTAADGQEDKLSIHGGNNQIFTGDMDDYVEISTIGFNDGSSASGGGPQDNNYIDTGSGNDTIVVNTAGNTIHAGDGDDTITIGHEESNGSTGYWQNNTIDGGSGNNIIHDYYNGTSTGGGDLTLTIKYGETKTITVDGKTYTVSNTSDTNNEHKDFVLTYGVEDGKVKFTGNNDYVTGITITAASGQEDNILWGVHAGILNTGDLNDQVEIIDADTSKGITGGGGSEINTGDGDDTVIIQNNGNGWNAGNTINGGSGNDTIIANTGSNTINGGSGNDTITLNSTNNTVNTGLGTGDNVTSNGAYNNVKYVFNTSESKTITIGGKAYTVKNNGSANNEFTYSLDKKGKPTFSGTRFQITPKDDASLTFGANETKTIEIDGKTYTVKNNGAANNTFNWSLQLNSYNNQLTFTASDFEITAADGQKDYISLIGSNNKLDTGDMDDTINLINESTHNNTIISGSGNDTVYSHGVDNIINTGEGNDTVYADGTNEIIDTGEGDDYVIVSIGHNNNITTGDGNDKAELFWDAENNIINTGLGAGDSIIDNGISSTLKYEFNSSETKTLTIADKTYNVQNIGSQGNELSYSVDSSGKINFAGDNFIITAADGQDDNLGITGDNNTVNAGSGNNDVTINGGDNNNVNGSGNTNVTDNGTGSTVIKPDGGSIGFGAGESQVIDINGKKYTVINNGAENNKFDYTYDSAAEQITFKSNDFSITAAENQTDNVAISGNNNILNTGNLDDKVTVNAGSNNNTVNGGAGIDTIYDYGTNTKSSEFENDKNNNSVTLQAGESKDITIDGKTYTIKNNAGYEQSLNYSLNESTKEITFDGNRFDITAAAGQEDKVTLKGSYNKLDTGDGNDKITTDAFASNNTIAGGAGDDIITNNGLNNTIDGGAGNDILNQNTTSSTSVSGVEKINAQNKNNNITLGAHEQTVIEIKGLSYTLLNNSNNTSSISYSINDLTGELTFTADNLKITAASGQTDNITINGSYNEANTGDKNDTINIASGGHNNIQTGSDDNTVIIGGSGENSVTAGSGDDRIYINSNNNSWVTGGAGNDSIIVNGNGNKVVGGGGKDNVTINGNGNNWDDIGYDGDDYVAVTGKDNLIDGGTGYNKITNKGTGNTYKGFDELVDQDKNFNIQIDGNFSNNSKYGISTGILLPDTGFDISSRENAIAALQQIDDIILGLTTSRVDIGFQNNMLSSIMKANLTRITNLNTSLATIVDADTATEYNNLVAKAALIDSGRALQTQAAENQAAILKKLINSIAS